MGPLKKSQVTAAALAVAAGPGPSDTADWPPTRLSSGWLRTACPGKWSSNEGKSAASGSVDGSMWPAEALKSGGTVRRPSQS